MPRVSAAHLAARRRQILAAAVRCFARQGFHRATMHDIVRESSLSPGAIYRYFSSKEDLVAAIAAERHAAERALALRAAAHHDARAGLVELARAFFGPLSDRDEQQWRRVTVQLWAEALRNPAVMRVVRSGLVAPLRALTTLIDRAGREGGLARGADAEATARLAAAAFQGLVLQQAWDPQIDVARCASAAKTLLEAVFAPGPRPARRKSRPGTLRRRRR
jgi:TetR/AcrR family transcriptional regulator, transcriptional repressor of aconitase